MTVRGALISVSVDFPASTRLDSGDEECLIPLELFLVTIVLMPCILVAVMVIRMVRNTRVQSGRHASIIDHRWCCSEFMNIVTVNCGQKEDGASDRVSRRTCQITG